ncbi:sulfite exporter TauE/SafE family protein [Ancylothrix sp. C2]|uniref:sulfite exporter TauE/SafE family protein n=1 Tax=Ancylothrix sp. D3o TaxID=2953691 RepID=UPI0021BAF9EE|nr:sulfite exporter TauE/SafE family protein [Ancylothrix sp. D3o]MCT7952840.1 sulfite exporter TauE/SafE family protein [Ancylothrix sp. D3o]
MSIFFLGLVSFVAWSISAVAGGGSPIVLIPLTSFLLGTQSVAPTITIGMLIGNCQRILMFWKYINWPVSLWYFPGALVGAVLGAYSLSILDLKWLQLVIGIFLIVTVFSFWVSKKERTFEVKAWQFLPVGFLYAFISGLIGSSGPVMNPLYLNYGLLKEEMIATKSTHVVVVHIAKLIAYGTLGVLSPDALGYGLVIGLAAFPANLLGKFVLHKISEHQFRQTVLAMMALAGVLMVWSQRELLTFW